MNTYQADSGASRDIPDALKSPRTLEAEADQVRHRIDERLDSITARLSPGELLDQALGMVREHGGEFGHNLCAQVTRHPVPFILTGVGLSWLMLSSNSARSERGYDTDYEYYEDDADSLGVRGGSGRMRAAAAGVRSHVDDVKDAMGDAADHVRDTAESLKNGAEHAMDSAAAGMRHARESLHDVSGQMRAAGGRARRQARAAHEHLHDFFRDQPVLAGSLGMALGAVLAALIPPTQAEDRLMGDAADKAKATAKDVGGEQYERAREVARQAAQTIRDTVQSGGDAQAQRGSPGENRASDADVAAGHPT